MPRFTAGPIAVSVGAQTVYPCYTHSNNNRNSDQKSYKPIKCSFQQIGKEFCFIHFDNSFSSLDGLDADISNLPIGDTNLTGILIYNYSAVDSFS